MICFLHPMCIMGNLLALVYNFFYCLSRSALWDFRSAVPGLFYAFGLNRMLCGFKHTPRVVFILLYLIINCPYLGHAYVSTFPLSF